MTYKEKFSPSIFALNRGFNVALAVELGVNGAVLVQQITYLTNPGYGKTTDEVNWTKRSLSEFQQQDLPWLSDSTIKRELKRLEDDGVLLSRNDMNQTKYDRSKWYTVNWGAEVFGRLAKQEWEQSRHNAEAFGDGPTGHIDPPPSGQSEPIDPVNVTGSPSSKKIKNSKEAQPSNEVEDIVKNAIAIDRDEELEKVKLKPDHGPTVARFWHKMMSYHKKAKGHQAKVGQGEQKMLKVLLAALGPDGPVMIDHALASWDLFCKFASENYDVKLTHQPQIKGLAHCRDPLAEFAQLYPGTATDEDPYAGLAETTADLED